MTQEELRRKLLNMLDRAMSHPLLFSPQERKILSVVAIIARHDDILIDLILEKLVDEESP